MDESLHPFIGMDLSILFLTIDSKLDTNFGLKNLTSTQLDLNDLKPNLTWNLTWLETLVTSGLIQPDGENNELFLKMYV